MHCDVVQLLCDSDIEHYTHKYLSREIQHDPNSL